MCLLDSVVKELLRTGQPFARESLAIIAIGSRATFLLQEPNQDDGE
jgi:hypothetical protein